MLTRLLCAFLAVCLLAPAAASAKGRVLTVGDRGAAVLKLNTKLGELGYLAGGKTSRSRVYSQATYHAVMAFQKWEGIDRDGAAGPQTRGELKTARRPAPQVRTSAKHVEILLGKQVALLVKDGRVKRVVAVSSGAPGYSTPAGRYSVFRKEEMSWSVPYQVWLPKASYFNGGIAMHEYSSVPAYPASHGCVRIPQPFSGFVYRFAGMGTPVHVL